MYNFYNLEASFREYLIAGNANPVSIKNYLSDIRHFLGWLTFFVNSHASDKGQIDNPIQSFITSSTILDYKKYLQENNISHKTINRRLSTIRKFCSFCVDQQLLTENPAKHIINILALPNNHSQNITEEYEHHLKLEGLNQNIIISSLNTIQELLQTI